MLKGPPNIAVDAHRLSDELTAALPADFFALTPILISFFKIAVYRAGKRAAVLPPRSPSHLAADVTMAFNALTGDSDLSEVRSQANFFSPREQAAALYGASVAVFSKFFVQREAAA